MSKKIIFFILALTAIILITLYFTTQSNKKKFYTIAILSYSHAAEPAILGLKTGLAEHGMYQGVDYRIIYNGGIFDKEELKAEAEKLASMKPDIFYTMTTPATLVCKDIALKHNIPVVFGPVSFARKTGIVDSLTNKSENITGVTFGPQEQRRFELLTQIAPNIKRVVIPYNPNEKSLHAGLKLIKPVADKLNIEIIELHITSPEMVETSLYKLREPYDAIFGITDSMVLSMTEAISQFAKQKRIPFTCPQLEGVKKGALFSYGLKVEDVGKQAARLVYMMLNGTPAKDLPVELAEFVLSINMETAEDIGIKIPEYLSDSAIVIGHSHAN